MRVEVRHFHDVAVAVSRKQVLSAGSEASRFRPIRVIRARNRRRDGRAMPSHRVVRLRPFVAILIRRRDDLRVVVVIERNRHVRRIGDKIIPAGGHAPRLVVIRAGLLRIGRAHLHD